LLDRLKRVLVESFVGAICLGFLFAQGFLHLAYIFATPIASWISRKEYRALSNTAPEFSTKFHLEDAVPELARAIFLLLLGYILLRWLYFKPVTEKLPERTSLIEPSGP
jgi:hypothetical protein